MKNRIILHIDMNSYFASVEQQANPFLRGRPVGVCAYLSGNGVIIASSIEAKAKGIKTGCRVREAKKLDPGVILLENEPAKYRSTTEKIFNILKNYSDTIEPYSIDEAFVDLSGWVKNFAKAKDIGRQIQARIKKEVGEWLDSSVGIAKTKFLAKFASDIAPKKSVLLITEANLEECLRNRPLTDAWGINVRMEARLKELGIYTLLDLKNFNKDRLRKALGRYGYYLWAGVNGEEITKISQGSPEPKSIGHSYALAKWTTDKKFLLSIFYKLAEKTGRRLRGAGKEAGGIMIGVAYAYGGGLSKSFSTRERLFTTEEIFVHIERLIRRSQIIMPVRNLAVSVFRLSSASNQMKLFEDNIAKKDLSRAMDKINNKYGEYVVVRGIMFNMKDKAVDRIGFRKSVEI